MQGERFELSKGLVYFYLTHRVSYHSKSKLNALERGAIDQAMRPLHILQLPSREINSLC